MFPYTMRIILGLCLTGFCRGHIGHLMGRVDEPHKTALPGVHDYGPSPGYTTSIFDSSPADGVVSRSEMMREFNCYDTDDDGLISRCEWTNRQTRFWGQEVTTGGELFDMLDGNVDDHITPDEFQSMLDTADTIKRDGMVTNSEFTACWEKMLRTARRMAGMPLPPVKYQCNRSPEERQLQFDFHQFLEDIDRNYDRHVQKVEGDPIADNAIFDLATWVGVSTTRYKLNGAAAFAMYHLLDMDMSGDLSREDFANSRLDTDMDGLVSICEEWSHVSSVAKLAEDYANILMSQNTILYKLLYGLDYVTPVKRRRCPESSFCLQRLPGSGSLEDDFLEHAKIHQQIMQLASQNPYFKKAQRQSGCETTIQQGTTTNSSMRSENRQGQGQGVVPKRGQGQEANQEQAETQAQQQQTQQPQETTDGQDSTTMPTETAAEVEGEGQEEGQEDYEPDLSDLEVRGFFKIHS